MDDYCQNKIFVFLVLNLIMFVLQLNNYLLACYENLFLLVFRGRSHIT